MKRRMFSSDRPMSAFDKFCAVAAVATWTIVFVAWLVLP